MAIYEKGQNWKGLINYKSEFECYDTIQLTLIIQSMDVLIKIGYFKSNFQPIKYKNHYMYLDVPLKFHDNKKLPTHFILALSYLLQSHDNNFFEKLKNIFYKSSSFWHNSNINLNNYKCVLGFNLQKEAKLMFLPKKTFLSTYFQEINNDEY